MPIVSRSGLENWPNFAKPERVSPVQEPLQTLLYIYTVLDMRSRQRTKRRSGSFKRGAEREFSHKVDIEVPPTGLGRRLLFMMKWCRETAGEGNWANHGYMNVDSPEGHPQDCARFYFRDYETAEAFAKEFAGKLTASIKSYRSFSR